MNKTEKRRIVRHCVICGHIINIYLTKTRRIPDNIGYYPDLKINGKEYWECAVCTTVENERK